MGADLKAMGAHTVADIAAIPPALLLQAFGDRTARFLTAAAQGRDPTPVVPLGPPKSVTVEDSFRSCKGHAAALAVLQGLAPDLLGRLEEEAGEGRRPGQVTVKWRLRGQGWKRRYVSGGGSWVHVFRELMVCVHAHVKRHVV
jgi:nucleotidyltransferase/DNA polymerase involved in DNA repair